MRLISTNIGDKLDPEFKKELMGQLMQTVYRMPFGFYEIEDIQKYSHAFDGIVQMRSDFRGEIVDKFALKPPKGFKMINI